jgi:hypothetical protein
MVRIENDALRQQLIAEIRLRAEGWKSQADRAQTETDARLARVRAAVLETLITDLEVAAMLPAPARPRRLQPAVH